MTARGHSIRQVKEALSGHAGGYESKPRLVPPPRAPPHSCPALAAPLLPEKRRAQGSPTAVLLSSIL